jgi:hypothetical protein
MHACWGWQNLLVSYNPKVKRVSLWTISVLYNYAKNSWWLPDKVHRSYIVSYIKKKWYDNINREETWLDFTNIDTCNREEKLYLYLYIEINDDMRKNIVKINYVRSLWCERSCIVHWCQEKERENESRDQAYTCFLIGSDVGQVENHNSLKEEAGTFYTK